MKSQTKEQNQIKRLTMLSWAKLLLSRGDVSQAQYNQMVSKVNKKFA